MDTSPPVVLPTPYKSRREWLIAFGIAEILMGCGFLLMLALSAFAFLRTANTSPVMMSSSPITRTAVMVAVSLQYLLMAAVFFIGGIGSIRCKNWARILMLVVNGLWLGCGLLGTLMMAFVFPAIMRQQPGNAPPAIQNAIIVGVIASMSFFMVVLPAIFLFFYTRKSVRATCLALSTADGVLTAETESRTSRLPVPLGVLAVWEALSALSVFAILVMPVTTVFGVVLKGIPASMILLAQSLLSAYAAWTIFRQQIIGWQVSLFKSCFWMVTMLVSALHHPDMATLFSQMGYNDQTLLVYQQYPQMMTVIWVGTAVMMTAVIVFVLYARKSFPPEPRP